MTRPEKANALAGHRLGNTRWYTLATTTLRTLKWGAKKPQSRIKIVSMHQLRLWGGWRYRSILGVACQQCKFRYTGRGGKSSIAELQLVTKIAGDHISQCYRNR